MITQPVAIFVIVLAVILLAPMVMRLLRLPPIIGMILAGVLVGPYGLHILGRDMSFEVFGQVGILYLMFLAGLEIDMYHLKRNLAKGAVFGVFTFVIPLAAGYAASRWLLGLTPLASMLAATLFSAHTLIGYPIIARYGLTKQPAVIIALTGTIVTVLASLVVLASVVGVYREGAFQPLALLALLARLVAFCLVVGWAYPRVTRWFFRKHIGGVEQFVYVLFMAFLAATVAWLIGIEGVFGAFYAGLVLNRYIPARSSLMARIEFTGNAIFIPYFLIGVGMMINVGVITSGWATLYVAAVVSGVAIAAKWLAAFATQVAFGMGRIDRSVLYQLSNAHTAVALAVVMIGYSLGVFDDSMLNGTVLMILVTCTVATIGVQRAAGRLALARLDPVTSGSDATPHRPSSHALISLRKPEAARQLVSLALLLGGGRGGPDSKLYALHVRSDNSPRSIARGREALDMATRSASAVDATLTPIERFDLNVVTGVRNVIAERDISTLIVGLHERQGPTDAFLGSKLEQLINAHNGMVLMSRTFIPLNTLRRIAVLVPARAELESGFVEWVQTLGNLTRQAGCRINFHCWPATRRAVTSVLLHGRFGIDFTFSEMEHPDDYVTLAGRVADDELLVVVSARRATVSFAPWLDEIVAFVQRYLARNNVIVLYPSQHGSSAPEIPSISTAVGADAFTRRSAFLAWAKRLLRAH